MQELKKLSIIIPVFNEEKTIFDLLKKVDELQLINGVEKEMIIVNDASSDASFERINEFLADCKNQNIVSLNHAINQGKGAGIHTGLKAATGDWIVIQDADLELDPNDINKLMQPIIQNGVEIVYGSRFLDKTNKPGDSFMARQANMFLTWLSNVVFRIKITDMETCYKMVRADLFKGLDLKEQRFGFEPEITAKLAKIKSARFQEIPITYNARMAADGKKIGWKDGVRAMYCIIKYGWFSK
ncbi:MAG: glycosyltransferase family 2 protein [Putridiphycobacter sp.]|nr:glycosyltransferase family 2 protein [Putridiphycobacter sp.]